MRFILFDTRREFCDKNRKIFNLHVYTGHTCLHYWFEHNWDHDVVIVILVSIIIALTRRDTAVENIFERVSALFASMISSGYLTKWRV